LQNISKVIQKELNTKNWLEEFGENQTLLTPIGEVKIGNNQYEKLLAKNRVDDFSMIKPTLKYPTIIIQNITDEFIFIKAFKGRTKNIIFNSIAINKFDLNIVISSFKTRENSILNKLISGANIVWTFVDNIFEAGINFSRQTTTTGHDKSLMSYSLSKSPTDTDIISQNILKLQELIKLDIPCVILAGGKSSRMGSDKCFLSFKDTTLIEYQYKRLKKIFSQVYISAKTNKFDFDCDIIYDKSDDISSPMVALKSILESINNPKVFILTVDIPLLTTNTIKKLIQNSSNYDITIAKDNYKTHNLCGVYSTTLLDKVQQYLLDDNHKINHLLKSSNYYELYINNDDEFLNINTKDDYSLLV
jgi:molybdopterin-guanine dinucleotide biosynthesis protein A